MLHFLNTDSHEFGTENSKSCPIDWYNCCSKRCLALIAQKLCWAWLRDYKVLEFLKDARTRDKARRGITGTRPGGVMQYRVPSGALQNYVSFAVLDGATSCQMNSCMKGTEQYVCQDIQAVDSRGLYGEDKRREGVWVKYHRIVGVCKRNTESSRQQLSTMLTMTDTRTNQSSKYDSRDQRHLQGTLCRTKHRLQLSGMTW